MTPPNPLDVIAEACHEANRVVTRHIGDVPVQPAWADAPEGMRESCLRGVRFALEKPDATSEEMHGSWMAAQLAAGWRWGPKRDDVAKTHPALVPFDDLPPEVRAKDRLFRSIVRALAPLVARCEGKVTP